MHDAISIAIARAGLVPDCLRCEICCRFPEADSALAPFFGNAEIERATRDGLSATAFPVGNYGAGHSALLTPEGAIHRCPAFRPGGNDCSIYANRPLDCRLYPFMLMYSRDGAQVLLGVDSYCPATAERLDDPAVRALGSELAELLDGPLHAEALACAGIVGEWKEHVHALGPLPRLTRDLCRTDLGLARFTPAAREAMEPYYAAQRGALSHHAFAPVWVWSDLFDLRWKVAHRRLLIFAQGDGDAFLICPPLGEGDPAPAAAEALEILRALDPAAPSPRIQEADAGTAAALAASGWKVRERQPEYVYRREDLAELRGNRFEKKRQPCNRFERERAWRFRPFEPEDLPAAVALYRRWLRGKEAATTEGHGEPRRTDVEESSSESVLRGSPRPSMVDPAEFSQAQAEASFWSVYRGLRDRDRIGLAARVLEADGRMAGFTTGCALHDGETFHVLHEVSDLSIQGAAQVMFREFCREMRSFEWINAGSASGLAALARVKESYRPLRKPESLTLKPTQ